MLLKPPYYLKKYFFSYILLLILPVLPFIVGAKLQWMIHVLLLCTVILEGKKIIKSKQTIWTLLLIIPVIWSFYSTLDGETYYIIQSLFYLLTPFIMVTLGTQLAGLIGSKRDLYRYIVYSGTVGASFYILIGMFKLGMGIFTDIYMLRNLVLWSSITNIIAIVILLFAERYDQIKVISKKSTKNWVLIINILGLILTASRTYYIIFLIFLLLILFKYQKKVFIILLTSLVGILLFVLSLNSDSLMVYKIQNSLTEITNTKNAASYEEVNTYYRAYETQQALLTYTSGNEREVILGHGLQKLVDLNIYVDLAGEMRRFIPVLHNGYAYLLLRLGALGALFYLIFFIKSLFVWNRSYKDVFLYLICVGTILGLLISNYVIGTFFQQEMMFAWIMIGINFILSERKKKVM